MTASCAQDQSNNEQNQDRQQGARNPSLTRMLPDVQQEQPSILRRYKVSDRVSWCLQQRTQLHPNEIDWQQGALHASNKNVTRCAAKAAIHIEETPSIQREPCQLVFAVEDTTSSKTTSSVTTTTQGTYRCDERIFLRNIRIPEFVNGQHICGVGAHLFDSPTCPYDVILGQDFL